MRKRILAFAYEFAPGGSPGAIKTAGMLRELAKSFDITVITAETTPRPDDSSDGLKVRTAPARDLRPWIAVLDRVRLGRLGRFWLWPDHAVTWTLAATLAMGREKRSYDAVCAFVMPYGSAFAAVLASRLLQAPLILNFADSPTCTGIHLRYESILHRWAARWLEDWLIRRSTRSVYVSKVNLARVAARLKPSQAKKLVLVRRGASPDFKKFDSTLEAGASLRGDMVTILYAGGLRGWLKFYQPEQEASLRRLLRQVVHAFNEWGSWRDPDVDVSTHAPIYLGRAIRQFVSDRPQWQGKIKLKVVGNQFVDRIVQSVLIREHLTDVLEVLPPRSADQIPPLVAESDVLFLCLHDRRQGRDGIMSSKTYEYLMTSKPIIAAVPDGENREFLQGREGVWCVPPRGEQEMVQALERVLVEGQRVFPRPRAEEELGFAARAEEFGRVLTEVCSGKFFPP